MEITIVIELIVSTLAIGFLARIEVGKPGWLSTDLFLLLDGLLRLGLNRREILWFIFLVVDKRLTQATLFPALLLLESDHKLWVQMEVSS